MDVQLCVSVEEQVNRFRVVNREQQWGFRDDTFERLVKTAPAWPGNELGIRSLRIRFGEGETGVRQTYLAHRKALRYALGLEEDTCWKTFPDDHERIRLAVGDDTHQPVVEWATIDFAAHRSRESVDAVRGSGLADELLVAAWLLPIEDALGFGCLPSFIAGGYECNEHERDRKPWRSSPTFLLCPDCQGLQMDVIHRGSDCAHFSVPVLLG